MSSNTDSPDLRARLAEVEADRDKTQRENAELRRRLREMEQQANVPRRAIDTRGLPKD